MVISKSGVTNLQRSGDCMWPSLDIKRACVFLEGVLIGPFSTLRWPRIFLTWRVCFVSFGCLSPLKRRQNYLTCSLESIKVFKVIFETLETIVMTPLAESSSEENSAGWGMTRVVVWGPQECMWAGIHMLATPELELTEQSSCASVNFLLDSCKHDREITKAK